MAVLMPAICDRYVPEGIGLSESPGVAEVNTGSWEEEGQEG